ncbi:hypothetical protein HELRODRAFT_167723 [Helobdella robusta]|uniref:Uncharacterized protein n=1 Tax=Helobdella robusta TaxID=6412 RepID=T1EZQ4_HELRO|nr:hypothetical protein HELRODRAFT_167723 [Helobdella robusta]ESO09905.1 hypothetical protein HELRODRAFT_167723 [Helobdella robusta]
MKIRKWLHSSNVDTQAACKKCRKEATIEYKLYKSLTNVNDLTSIESRTSPQTTGSNANIRVYRNTCPKAISSSGLKRNTITNNKDYIFSKNAPKKQSAEDLSSLLRCRNGNARGSSISLHRSSVKRIRSNISFSSIDYNDFPTVSKVKHKMIAFERVFTAKVIDLFNELKTEKQLELLSYGVQLSTNGMNFISIKKYLSSIIPSTENVKPIITETQFCSLKKCLHDKLEEKRAITNVATQILTSFLTQASKELSRIFEYQIGLISDGLSLDLLCLYAAECLINHITTHRNLSMNVNSIVQAVIWGLPKNQNKWQKCQMSILIGDKELKWRLNEIFSKSGLRVDSLLLCENLTECFDQNLWRFYSPPHCNNVLYGYRGLVLEKDFFKNTFHAYKNDLTFTNELYVPYKRLIRYHPEDPFNLHAQNHLEKIFSKFFSKNDYELINCELQRTNAKEQINIAGLETDVETNADDDCTSDINCGIFENSVLENKMIAPNKTDKTHFDIATTNKNKISNVPNNTKVTDTLSTLQTTLRQPQTTTFDSVLPNLSEPGYLKPNLTIPNITISSRRSSRVSIDNTEKPVLKFCFTPVKSSKLVEGQSYFSSHHLDSIELQDMYHATEESQHYTTTRSFSADLSSTTADNLNSDQNKYEESDTVSQGSMESYHDSLTESKISENFNRNTKNVLQESFSISQIQEEYEENDESKH